ncbi:unnamed protein product, partial [Ranitomeya imitator]
MHQHFGRVRVEERTDYGNIFELEATGGCESLDVQFEGQGRVKGYSEAADFQDNGKSDREDVRDGGKIISSVLSTLSLRKREEKKEDMADRHSGILESREFFPSLPVFTSDSMSYYQILSDQDGYKHIHYVNDTMANAVQITKGRWEAVYILYVTDKAIYYTSNEFEGFPGRRNVYRISLQGKRREKQCLTCTLRKERCQYYYAKLSTNAKYYSLSCYGESLEPSPIT